MNRKKQLSVSVLTDNVPGKDYLSEHGLSFFIEFSGKKVLFDTGQSDVFLRNASLMGLSLHNRDLIILSHGHFDHGNGLSYLEGGRLLCHPGCFVKRYRASDMSYIGLGNSRNELQKKFDLITSAVPFSVGERIVFLGEVPRNTAFESKNTSFVLEGGEPDFVMDDSGVALLHDEGLFVITGCGHAGVVNTLEHARKVTGEKRLFGIMGGFHLKQVDRQTVETVEYLKTNGVKHVLPSHCTAQPALEAFYKQFGKHTVRTGEVYRF